MTRKNDLYTLFDGMCVKCLVRFGYWIAKTTKESNDILLKNGIDIGFGKPEYDKLTNKFVEHATDGEIAFKNNLVKLLWNIPDMYPVGPLQDLAIEHCIGEANKALRYCKGDGFIGHKQDLAIKFNLEKKAGFTISQKEALPNKQEEKRIFLGYKGDKKK